MSTKEKRYTLREARAIIAQQQCGAAGHDLEIVVSGTGDPTDLLCACCGRMWAVIER